MHDRIPEQRFRASVVALVMLAKNLTSITRGGEPASNQTLSKTMQEHCPAFDMPSEFDTAAPLCNRVQKWLGTIWGHLQTRWGHSYRLREHSGSLTSASRSHMHPVQIFENIVGLAHLSPWSEGGWH